MFMFLLFLFARNFSYRSWWLLSDPETHEGVRLPKDDGDAAQVLHVTGPPRDGARPDVANALQDAAYPAEDGVRVEHGHSDLTGIFIVSAAFGWKRFARKRTMETVVGGSRTRYGADFSQDAKQWPLFAG